MELWAQNICDLDITLISVVTVVEIDTETAVFFGNIEPYRNRGFVLYIDGFGFYARKQLLLSAYLSHRNSLRPSVTWVDQSKTAQARITKSSLSAAWKTLVSRTVKLFHKFEGGHPERGC